ncbi:MAG: hypothetical protein AAGB30_10735 [Pedobacter sp.]
MRKKSKNLSKFFFGLFILVVVTGCKKDNEPDVQDERQQLRNAKSWFTKQQQSQTTSFKNNKGNTLSLTYVPDWDHAKIENIEGKTIITTDVETNLQSIYGKNTYFVLVIKSEHNSFESKTLKISSFDGKNEKNLLDENEIYKTAFTNEDLSGNGINADIKVYDSKFKSNGSILYTLTGRTMISDQQPSSNWKPYNIAIADGKKSFTTNSLPKTMQQVCYDAYMVTRVYEDGVLIDIYQEYLGFQICYDSEYMNPEDLGGGSPGGGPSGENQINLEWGTPVSNAYASIFISSQAATSTEPEKRTLQYPWVFMDGGPSYQFIGYEQGVHFKSGNTWLWESLSHLSHNVQGILIGSDVQIMMNFTQATINEPYATMVLNYHTKRTIIGGGTQAVYYSKAEASSHSWTTAD